MTHESPDDLLEPKKKGDSSWFLPWLSILLGVMLFGVYIGNLLFGTNSLEVLLRLRSYENELKHQVERLREENARLQKEYFELKRLEP